MLNEYTDRASILNSILTSKIFKIWHGILLITFVFFQEWALNSFPIWQLKMQYFFYKESFFPKFNIKVLFLISNLLILTCMWRVDSLEKTDAGRDWGQEEKGTTEYEMAGWHHWLDGCESQWTPGVGDGQGGLVCCDSWGHKESDMTEWTELNWTDSLRICISF